MQANAKPVQSDIFATLPIPVALRKMILPAVASQLIVLIYNMADTFFVGRTNNPYMVASTSLILPVFNITLCLAGLAGIGGGSLISRLLGSGRPEEARKVSVFSLYLGLSIAALFALGTGLFMGPLLGLLGAGENTYHYAQQYATCVIVIGGIPTVLSNVLATPLMFLSFFTVYLFQAFGKGRVSLFLGVTRWLFLNIPMLFLLNAIFGMFGIVWSQITADTLNVLLSFYIYFRFRPSANELQPNHVQQGLKS